MEDIIVLDNLIKTCEMSFNIKHRYTLTQCDDIINDIVTTTNEFNSPKIKLTRESGSAYTFDYVSFEVPLNFENCPKVILDVFDGKNIGLSVMFDINVDRMIKFYDCIY